MTDNFIAKITCIKFAVAAYGSDATWILMELFLRISDISVELESILY